MAKVKLIPGVFFLTLIFLSVELSAQYNFQLESVLSPNEKEAVLEFGAPANIKINCEIDSSHTMKDALAYLRQYYVAVNGIPYREFKVSDMTFLYGKKIAKESPQNIYEIVYQTTISPSTQNVNGKTELSQFWVHHYEPLRSQLTLSFTLLSEGAEDVVFLPATMQLKFYSTWRVLVFVFFFALLLFLVFYFASRSHFSLFRDDKSACTDASKRPFSLSRVQVFLWTFTIFGFFAFIWATTGFLPELTAGHLVLLGIAAGQRIIAQIIDSQKNPVKNFTTNQLTNGCSQGFFTDMISDSTGLSISRLQYLIATFIFMVVFITTAIQKLVLVDFSVEQLALMGTSAGLYLWDKKLEQKA